MSFVSVIGETAEC